MVSGRKKVRFQKNDALRLKVLEILKREGPQSLSNLQRAAKSPHFKTIKAAVVFLEALDLVHVKDTKDKLGTKLVSLTKQGASLDLPTFKKRGEAHHVLRYLIIAAIIIVIQLFGFYAIAAVKEQLCKTELAGFEIDMRDLDKGVEFGSFVQKVLGVPCKTEKIIFVDEDKAKPVLFDNPLMRDSVESGAPDNVFVFKDEDVKSKFYTGQLDLRYPGFLCIQSQFDDVDFYVEGRKDGVAILAGCLQADCTYIPEEVIRQDAQAILQEFIDFGFYESTLCPDCPQNIDTELRNYEETLPHIDVLRKFSYCTETGITEIEIIITPKDNAQLENFRFYERIPKHCVGDLEAYLVATIEGNVTIKNDPLIMWQFGLLDEEQRIAYQLRKDLSDECRKLIRGLGVAQFFTGGAPTPTPQAPIAIPAQPAPSPAPLPAVLSATYSNLQKNTGPPPLGWSAGQNWWYYDVTLEETSGNSGVTIQGIQKCYDSPGPPPTSWCDPINTDVVGLYGTSYLSLGSQLSSPSPQNFVVFDPGFQYTTTATIRGFDDTGIFVLDTYSFSVLS